MIPQTPKTRNRCWNSAHLSYHKTKNLATFICSNTYRGTNLVSVSFSEIASFTTSSFAIWAAAPLSYHKTPKPAIEFPQQTDSALKSIIYVCVQKNQVKSWQFRQFYDNIFIWK